MIEEADTFTLYIDIKVFLMLKEKNVNRHKEP